MTDGSLLIRLDALDQYVRDLRESQPRNFRAYEDDKTPALWQHPCHTCSATV